MGACVSRKKDEQFSINDLNGMEKYYSLMPRGKADILRWLTDSKGPWKTPDSFTCFQIIDTRTIPVKVSNDDEVRLHAIESKWNDDCKGTSSLQFDREEMCMTLNPVNSTLSTASSVDVNNGPLLDWPSDW